MSTLPDGWKNIKLLDVFTEAQVMKCVELKKADLILEQVVKPNIGQINKATGGFNDPRYWAYLLEHTVNELEKK